jgi:acyl-CoA thioesterase-1
MTRQNLARMTGDAQKAGAKVLLVGVQVPPNYGASYTKEFEDAFPQVAKAHHAAWVPSLLAGVGDAPDAPSLFQADRIHPKAQAHPRMLDNVWPELKKLL